MTASAALPTSRDLAGWWRDLAPWNPRRIWLAEIIVHAVEALATVAQPVALDGFARAVLRELGSHVGPPSLDVLRDRLRLDRQFLRRILHELNCLGLAGADTGGHWSLSPLGRAGLPREQFAAADLRRRVFHFLDRSGQSLPPHYLLLDPLAHGRPIVAPAGWAFDAHVLRGCVQQSDEWKALHRFPAEVLAVADQADDWRQVAVDRPEAWSLALSESDDGWLRGFRGRGDGTVHPQPALTLPAAAAHDLFPDLHHPPTAAEWHRAWMVQAVAGGVAANDAERCRVEPDDARLLVRAPPAVATRWTGRSLWALAGPPALRRALPIEVTAST